MVQGGRSLYEGQKILGHSTPTLTQRYAHLSPERGRDAVAVLDRTLELNSRAYQSATQERESSSVSG